MTLFEYLDSCDFIEYIALPKSDNNDKIYCQKMWAMLKEIR